MRAVVTGLLATFPVGGVFYDYVQYAVGLERLGFEVWYLEDTNTPLFDLDDRDYDYNGRWDAAADRLRRRLAGISPTLAERWHLRGYDGTERGIPSAEMTEIVVDADVLMNVSGVGVLREEYLPNRHKVFVDTDPGWNHFMRFPLADRRPDAVDGGYRAHDHHFTYAERIGRADCAIPDLDLSWHPTRPPVVTDLWQPAPTPPLDAPWTTVLSWDNVPAGAGGGEQLSIVDSDRRYGTKEIEFIRVEDLPDRVDVTLEIAAGGAHPPVDRWRALGWSVVDSIEISRTPEAYRAYLIGSRGEFSVAKNVYVDTRSGWFSCRSLCYLAAGRPVVVQDTGFSDHIPTGEGILAFTDAAGAVTALADAERRYDDHASAAADIARTHFDAETVIGDLLDRTGVNG
ncbi:hypothetical protein BH23ACT9_BH23ACT9_05340 [soil metagenome]